MDKKSAQRYKGEVEGAQTPLKLAAIGLEAEFTLYVDEKKAQPEKVFGDPTGFIKTPMVHRVGTSYHLPTGGAVYFDTGVIEVATPAIEIAKGCAARAGRSLWESILFLRGALDEWEKESGRRARLKGFSAHYNISFEARAADNRIKPPTVEDLSLLLVHILPIPVLMIAANRLSTGVGLRPRGERVELTADFTPSPALMIAAATFVTSVARKVMTWPSYDLRELERRGIPVIEGFKPIPHTTRKGWLARAECFPQTPFKAESHDPVWSTNGDAPRSLRDIGRAVYEAFRPSVKRLSDAFTSRLLDSIFLRDAPILIDLPDRPEAYDDVGKLCFWDDLFPERALSRSLYERVLIRAIAGDVLRINGRSYVPIGMRGWSEVVFERLPERTRHRFSLDFLTDRLNEWER